MNIRAASLSEQIARHLADQIVRWELLPGAHLPELELAKQLDVSTNSLREAFRLLERQHLIEIQPRRGARVCEVTETQVRDLYDFLFLLLSELAARTARTWQGEQLADLAAILPDFERFHANNDIAAAHDVAFGFVAIAVNRFSANQYLANDIEDLLPLLRRYSYLALKEETSELSVSLVIFQNLLRNVLARDAEAAAADIREYGDKQCQIVLRAVAKRAAA
ncbi:MAG: GntR family transcriptional regulator [Alcanivoracaceae bacterium]|nr:GntR family transcriptional regulator [Alcanivoracaceae bacterium]